MNTEEDRHAVPTRATGLGQTRSQRLKRATFHGFSNKSAACRLPRSFHYHRLTLSISVSVSFSFALHSFDFDLPQTPIGFVFRNPDGSRYADGGKRRGIEFAAPPQRRIAGMRIP